MKTAMLVSLVMLAGLMGGCPAPGVTAPGATQSGLVEGIYTGTVSVAITQRQNGTIIRESHDTRLETFVFNSQGRPVIDNNPVTVGDTFYTNTPTEIIEYRVASIRESSDTLLVDYDVTSELIANGVRYTATGSENVVYRQINPNTITYQSIRTYQYLFFGSVIMGEVELLGELTK